MEGARKRRMNYLSVDGGYSGLPALYILNEVLGKLAFNLKLNQELPWQHFEMMIGTGHGGLVVILIGRLRLTLSKAIEAYMKLVLVIPIEPAKDDEERKRNTEAFRAAFIEILKEAGFDENAPMLDDDGTKIVVCASNTLNFSLLHPIRSYRTQGAKPAPFTILDAACACMASPDTFLPFKIRIGHKQVTLIDALAVAANPCKELLREAQQVFGEDVEVATILSIGAGKGDVWDLSSTSGSELKEAVKLATKSSESVHEDLRVRLAETLIYFRLNVDRASGPQMEVSSANVSAYLGHGVISDRVGEAIKSIHDRAVGVKLKALNSVTPIKIALKPRPSLVSNFVGREDILEAMNRNHITQRSTNSGRPVITVLSGVGGSGKTQTALKFALNFEARRPDAPVYFINAGTEATLKADFETIIRSRGIEYHSLSYHDALTWLATRPEDWLVIMDNADDVSFRLLPYIPQSAYGNIIVTTRNPNHAPLAPKNSYHLEGLSMEDAINVILTASGYDQTEANRALARAIVEELGHLPLALAQAAGYIFVHRCLSTYLLIYRRSTRLLLGTGPSELAHDYPSSVATTIQMSLARLPAHALNILCLFSHLDPTWIPHAIISRAANRKFRRVERTKECDLNMQTRKQADALVEIFYVDDQWSEVDFHELIDYCLQYSLLRLTRQGGSDFYSMHILVQSYLQGTAHMVQGHRPGPLIVRLLGSSITYSHDSKYLGFNRFLPPHLRQIQMEDVIEAGDHAAFGHVMERAGDNKSAVLHLERCVEMWRESLGHEHENTLSAIVNLANSYRVIGKAQKASELEEDVLGVQKRTLGKEHHDTLLTAGNLAASYIELKRYEEAMELGKQVLEARKRVLEPEDADNVITMGNLAVCYANIGRNREALELEEQVLEIWNRSFGPEDPGTLRAMSNLAESYRVEGRRQEALELNQKVLEMQAKVIGPEHPDTLLPIRLQLLILRDLGMTEQVQELLQTALPAHKKLLGMDHPDTVWFRDEFGAQLTPPGPL